MHVEREIHLWRRAQVRISDADPGYGVPMATIGYYVHHHGTGHVSRYEKIRTAMEGSGHALTALSERDIDGGVVLPSDRVDPAIDPEAGGALHWAPVGSHASARRTHCVLDWILGARPAGMVVDVSVEMATLARLAGLATVVVRQHGNRTDQPHTLAYRSAMRLLAPFPQQLEHADTPQWVIDKTSYSGFVSEAKCSGSHRRDVPSPSDVVVLWGTGGGRLSPRALESLADAAAPNRVWFAGCMGERLGDEPSHRANVKHLGWVDDVAALLSRRPIVVTSAGNNTVSDAAGADCPLIVCPQARPFDEQRRHGEALDAAGACAVATPTMSCADWSAAISAARERRSTLGALAGTHGARRAADIIVSALVERSVGPDSERLGIATPVFSSRS